MNQNAILDPKDRFHLGIVTTDPDATAAMLTSVLGYEWGITVGNAVEVTGPDGVHTVELSCAFSVTEPRLEVVRAVAGTLWEPVPGSGIHHLGYWSDDVTADTAALREHGWDLEAGRVMPDGKLFFAFLSGAQGFRVELVDRRAQAGMSQCWAPVAGR
ncbi:VOC family protein [Nocardia alni]|uniref:VOC family protein n=1 Tax=Nocardia alni TaxID=2815723 RepID=UPI0027DFAC37|nr:VOC family protein [Nocardia alni]